MKASVEILHSFSEQFSRFCSGQGQKSIKKIAFKVLKDQMFHSFQYTMLHQYCHLLKTRYNFENVCLTRDCRQTLFCKQTIQAISISLILDPNSKGVNICVT